MDKNSLNNRSIWLAGLGTGLLVYGVAGKSLRYGKTMTITAGIVVIGISGAIFLLTRKKKA
jgi:hypothetical protein